MRRTGWAALLLTLALGGCGTAGSGEPAPVAPSTSGVVVRHALGELTLPAAARRVVTTSDEATELVVALGVKPLGVGSTRLPADADGAVQFAGYYLAPDQLGTPAYVGAEEISVEAVAALRPDLIVHVAQDETAAALAKVAPTAVFDVESPGGWQQALPAVGAATGTADRAGTILRDYQAALQQARDELAPVVRRTPRVAVLYPQYRGGADNFLFGPDFALAGTLPELGFTLAGSPRAEEAFPGVSSISSELYSTIDADLILALGTRPWQQTSSARMLERLGVPVVGVPLEDGQPAAGPLTSPDLLDTYRKALRS